MLTLIEASTTTLITLYLANEALKEQRRANGLNKESDDTRKVLHKELQAVINTLNKDIEQINKQQSLKDQKEALCNIFQRILEDDLKDIPSIQNEKAERLSEKIINAFKGQELTYDRQNNRFIFSSGKIELTDEELAIIDKTSQQAKTPIPK